MLIVVLEFDISLPKTQMCLRADVPGDYFTLIVPSVHVNDTGNTRLDTSDTHLDTGMKLRFINGSDNL